MLFNEADHPSVQVYGALSKDLIHWSPANNGKPILTYQDFLHTTWAGKDENGTNNQGTFVSDAIRYQGNWYLFLYGFNTSGKRQIGMAVSKCTLLGPYRIANNPIIKNGKKGSWNESGSFYPKVIKLNNRFVLFYSGIDDSGIEHIGRSFSSNLFHWSIDENPVITDHQGWRSVKSLSTPNYIEHRGDSLFLMVSGAKAFKQGFWHHYITRQLYKGKSGNVDDAQLGVYLSVDGGETFVPHKHNPVFVNDYSSPFENEHLGGNFKRIVTDTAEFIIYQAKSSYQGWKYNVMMRGRKR